MLRNAFVLLLVVFSFVASLSAAPGQLAGSVMTADAQPVVGAAISVHPLEGTTQRLLRLSSEHPVRPAAAIGKTDEHGSFLLRTTEPSVDVTIVAEGYVPRTIRSAADQDSGAIVLQKSDTKTGRVTDASGPVPGALVIYRGSDGSECSRVTDAAGSFSIPDPARWAAEITIRHAQHATLHYGARSGRAAELNWQLSAATSFEGVVTNSRSAGVIIAIDGFPVAVTQDEGKFRADHVAGQGSLIGASASGGYGEARRSGEKPIEIVMGKRFSIQGVVNDSRSGKTIPGAEIIASSETLPEPVSVITEADGRYSLDALNPSEYRLDLIMPGYVAKGSVAQLDGSSNIVADQALAPAAIVSGVVTDDGRRPVGAAIVRVVEVEGSASAPAVAWSAPDGRFVLLGVDQEGPAEIEALKADGPIAKSGALSLERGTVRRGVSIVLRNGVVISGFVRSNEGEPIAGATVTLAPEGSEDKVEVALAQSLTDAAGLFRIKIVSGTYDLTIRAAGYATKHLQAYTATRDGGPDIALDQEAAVHGRVVRGERGVGGVNILISQGSSVSVETSADGTFALAGLERGHATLSATKSSEYIAIQRDLEISGDEIVIEVGQAGRVSGRVIDRETQQPVPEFAVDVTNFNGSVASKFGNKRLFANAEGRFSLDDLPPGLVQLLISSEGHLVARSRRLNIESGKDVDDLEIELARPVMISGLVRDEAGAPVSGARVISTSAPSEKSDPLAGLAPRREALTGASGEYAMEVDNPEQVAYAKEGFATEFRRIETSSSSRLDIQLRAIDTAATQPPNEGLRPFPPASSISLSGHVEGLDSGDYARVDVIGRSAHGEWSAKLDASGRFTFQNVSGRLQLFARITAGDSWRTTPRITFDAGHPDATTPILEFAASRLRGSVHRDGVALADSIVLFRPLEDSGAEATTVTDATGTYDVRGLSAGRYEVVVSEPNPLRQYRTHIDRTESIARQDIDLAGGKLEGRVLTSLDGRPLKGVLVSLQSEEPRATALVTVTDGSGRFSFESAEAGSYRVMVEGDQFTSMSRAAIISDHSDSVVEFRLESKGGRP